MSTGRVAKFKRFARQQSPLPPSVLKSSNSCCHILSHMPKKTHRLFSFELKEKPENHKLLKEFNTLSQKQETVNVLIKYAVLEEARSCVPWTDVLSAEFGVWPSIGPLETH